MTNGGTGITPTRFTLDDTLRAIEEWLPQTHDDHYYQILYPDTRNHEIDGECDYDVHERYLFGVYCDICGSGFSDKDECMCDSKVDFTADSFHWYPDKLINMDSEAWEIYEAIADEQEPQWETEPPPFCRRRR